MATVAENLATIKANWVALLATESAYQVANGPKPSYSLDGVSYQWDAWRQNVSDRIEALNKAIQMEDGAFEVRSFGQV